MTTVGERSLWRNRDFLLLWSGQAVSSLGDQVSGLALPLLVLALTGSSAQAGLVLAASLLPYLALSLPAGVLVDRWDRKRVMIRCDVARVVALSSVPLAYHIGRLTMAQLYAVALVEGAAAVFFSLAETAALPRVVSRARLTEAAALNATADGAATVVGPGLAGLIIGLARGTVAGAALAYLVDSLSFLVSAVSLGAIRVPFQKERASWTGRSLRAELAEGLRYLWEQPRLRTVALLTLAVNLLYGPVPLAAIVLARQALRLDARAIGLIFSIGGVGALVGSLLTPRLKRWAGFGPLLTGVVALWALATLLLAVAVSPLILIAGWTLMDLVTPAYNVTQLSYRLTLIPDALQGRVNSAFRLLAFCGIPLGRAVGGLLLGPIGPRGELIALALGMSLCAVAAGLMGLRRA